MSWLIEKKRSCHIGVNTTTAPTSIQIMDFYDRLMITQDISEGQNTINISTLPTGTLIFVLGEQRYLVRWYYM